MSTRLLLRRRAQASALAEASADRRSLGGGWSAVAWAGLALFCSTVTLAAAVSSIVDAAKAGDEQAVRAMLQKKADVNAAEADGMTALHWAARNNDVGSARLLLRAGANAKATTRYGVTPLTLAAQNGSAPMLESAAQVRRRCQRGSPRGRDDADDGRSNGKRRCHQGACRSRR